MTTNDHDADMVRRQLQAECQLPTHADEDWERLTRRIVDAAGPVLRSRTTRPSWREELVALGRIGVPLALAAGIVALVLLSRVERTASGEAVPASAFLSALAGETSQETVLNLTLGEAGQSMILADRR
jgi:hypothetical protein